MKNIYKTFIGIALVGGSIPAVKAQDNVVPKQMKMDKGLYAAPSKPDTIVKHIPLSEPGYYVEGDGSDTTRIRMGSLKITMVDDKHHIDTTYTTLFHNKKKKAIRKAGYWSGFGLGFNNYLNAKGGTSTPPGYDYLELNTGKSINVTLNFFEQTVNLYHNHLLLVTGLGLEWNNYRFGSNVVLNPDQKSISAYKDTVNSPDKSKLVVDYINIPLILTFKTTSIRGRNFHIGAGVIAGYVWSSHTKRRYGSDGSKHKDYDDFNVNPFKATATVRIGYGDGFTLYGTYGLTNFFKDDQGPVLTPYSMGITMNF